jgi:hypothetical protein
MKTLLVLALVSTTVGCGSPSNTPADMAVPSDLSVSSDLGPDLSAQACQMIGAWPGLMPTGGYDDLQGVTAAFSRQAAGSPINELSVEAWHQEVYPHTTTFRDKDTYELCDTCIIYYEDCDDQGCAASYFVQGGSGTVTQADQDPAMGAMTASGKNLRLVEWDFDKDAPVANARCVEIASASWDVSWAVTDGGMHD